MALTVVPSEPTDLNHLERRVLNLRVIAYALSTIGSSAVAIGSGSESATILAILAGSGLVISVLLRRSRWGRLEVFLAIDVGGVAALWWLSGPVAAVDFALFYVVATAALLLPRVAALRITGSLLVVTLVQLILHLPALVGSLPFFHQVDQHRPTEEVVFRAILVVGAAVMFFTIAGMLRRAQEATEESEQRFRRLVEATPDAIVVHDGSKILFANPSAAQLVGAPIPEDLLGTRISRFLHIDLMDPAGRKTTGPLEETDAGQAEMTLTRIDGRVIQVETVDIPTIFDSKPASQVVLRDITERHLALQAVQESEERYKSFFEGIPTPLYRTTPDGRILDANAALVALLGYPDKRSLLDIEVHTAYVRPADRTASQEKLHRHGSLEDYDQELIRHDGSHIWVRDTSRIVSDAEGSVLYYEGTMVDITERKRAESTTQRLIRILEATTDFVAIADEEGHLLYANQAARDFSGVSSDSQTRHMLIKDAFGVEAENLLTDMVENEIWEGVLNLHKPDGSTVPASTVIINHRDDAGNVEYFSAVARDISERIAAQARLEKLVRSKDDFVASVSHELRTPLTAVVGLTQELRDNRTSFSAEETAEFIALIADQSAEVANIVEDLLVAARAEIGRIAIAPKAVHLADEIDIVLAALGLEGVDRVSVNVVGGAKAWADAARLRQILRNLVTNAVRYGGSDIGVQVGYRNESVFITVSDDGPGVPEEMRELIFEPYGRAHTVSTQPASVGLGLTVSRQLARLMHGDLIYRVGAEGSVFELSLPAHDG